jgi:DMSO reductase anchor subunit
MIYACIRFLQEWASPFTIANFFLMGSASGFMLAVPLAAIFAPARAGAYAAAAVVLTLAAFATRLASLARNERIRPKSTLQSAIGIDHPRVRQVTQGFTGDSFNTLEFFHGVTRDRMKAIRLAFLVLAFVAPVVVLLAARQWTTAGAWLAAAFAIQYAGLVLERWYFLAQSSHPQNLYYQNRA